MVSPASGLRIGLFGTFYPHIQGLAATSTGLAHLLSQNPRVQLVRVYAPLGSVIPPGVQGGKIEVVPCWVFDRPMTLIRSLKIICHSLQDVDVVVFNVYPTMFGRLPYANGVGMLLPSSVARLGRKPTFVYMHNFVETQEIESLGYRNSFALRSAAALLEKILLATTIVLVPLESQKTVIESRLGTAVSQFFVPYLEGALASDYLSRGNTPQPNEDYFSVMLFGSWGPQKDLQGVTLVLQRFCDLVPGARVVFAGSINQNFPEYAGKVSVALGQLPTARIETHVNPSDQVVARLLLGADLLLLPYSATGGYSAVMNMATLFGVRVLAYDLPQLRETANMLHEDVLFVEQGNREALLSAMLVELRSRTSRNRANKMDAAEIKLQRTRDSIAALVTRLTTEVEKGCR